MPQEMYFIHTCICIVFQVNVTSTNTMETISGLTPFTSYNCTLHAVTVSDGPLIDPIIVTTTEQGTHPLVCISDK